MTDPLLLLGYGVTFVTLGGYMLMLRRRVRSALERRASLAEQLAPLVDGTSSG